MYKTTAGWLNNREVVELEFDPAVVGYKDLIGKVLKLQCAGTVFTRNDEQDKTAKTIAKNVEHSDKAITPDKELKYYLSKSTWRFVPMTEAQACRALLPLSEGKNPAAYLSPRQIALHDFIEKNLKGGWKSVIGRDDLIAAWDEASKLQTQSEQSGGAEDF